MGLTFKGIIVFFSTMVAALVVYFVGTLPMVIFNEGSESNIFVYLQWLILVLASVFYIRIETRITERFGISHTLFKIITIAGLLCAAISEYFLTLVFIEMIDGVMFSGLGVFIGWVIVCIGYAITAAVSIIHAICLMVRNHTHIQKQ